MPRRQAVPLSAETIRLRRRRPGVAAQPVARPAPAQLVAGLKISPYRLRYLRRLMAEKLRRRCEALHLYDPLPEQASFHASHARQRIIRGSNRAGKTLAAAVEVARAVTGQDPHGKYPVKDGRFYLVGRDLKHVAETMWRALYKPGAFKMIRDLVTNQWRSFRPWDPADAARASEAKRAPPLIPHRLIGAKGIAWENAAKGIPSKVRLKNGWEIDFFSSDAKPRRGVDIDGWWVDEELHDEEWHSELVARILDRKGRGLWSATPQSGNDALLSLSERAAEQVTEANPAVTEHIVLLMDNPHVGAAEKAEFISSLSEQDIDVRVHGEFAQKSRRVFPEWDKKLHLCNFFNIPAHYTLFASVDPGRQVCAVLFGALPPLIDEEDPMAGDFLYLFDELYIKNCTADMFGQKMRQKCQGRQIEAFIIDRCGGRLVDIGGGRSVEVQYADALRKYKVKSRRTGSNFLPSSDDVEGGLEAARALLRIREDGTCKLRVLDGCLPRFEGEITRYRYKLEKGDISDKPEQRGPVHQMANFRYLAAFAPRHRSVQKDAASRNPALGALRSKQERLRKKKGPTRVLLGPGQWQGRGE